VAQDKRRNRMPQAARRRCCLDLTYLLIFFWLKYLVGVCVSRISATLSCPMTLHKYPLDSQSCPMMFESC